LIFDKTLIFDLYNIGYIFIFHSNFNFLNPAQDSDPIQLEDSALRNVDTHIRVHYEPSTQFDHDQGDHRSRSHSITASTAGNDLRNTLTATTDDRLNKMDARLDR